MKAKNKKIRHTTIMYVWLMLLTFIVAIATSVTFYSISRGEPSIDKTVQELQKAQGRLRFCYDNNVAPCTDSQIEEWNATHPSKAFHL